MQLFVWLQHLAYLVFNLCILAIIKLRFPDSLVGQTIAVIA